MVQVLVDKTEENPHAQDGTVLREGLFKPHRERVELDIRALGANYYDMLLPETRTLPLIVQPGEPILGAVYGRYRQDGMQDSSSGRGVILATDKRVLLVDHKPLFLKCAEYPYSVISAVSYSRASGIYSVTIYSRVGNLTIRSANKKMAVNLIAAIQAKLIKAPGGYDMLNNY